MTSRALTFSSLLARPPFDIAALTGPIEKAQRTSLIEVDAQCLFCPEQETVPVGNATFMSPEGSEGDLEGEEASGEIDFTFYVNQVSVLRFLDCTRVFLLTGRT